VPPSSVQSVSKVKTRTEKPKESIYKEESILKKQRKKQLSGANATHYICQAAKLASSAVLESKCGGSVQ
jgi:hypothetical protein